MVSGQCLPLYSALYTIRGTYVLIRPWNRQTGCVHPTKDKLRVEEQFSYLNLDQNEGILSAVIFINSRRVYVLSQQE